MAARALKLRGDWHQVVVTTVPAMTGEIIPLLDRALDLLAEHDQLDQDSLIMAADLVVSRTVGVSPRDGDVLRVRLVRATHDFLVVPAPPDDTSWEASGRAFESEVSLAAALFRGGEVGLEDPPEESEPREGVITRLDREGLEQALWQRPPRWRKAAGGGRLLALFAVIVLGLVYISRNHPLPPRLPFAPPSPRSVIGAPPPPAWAAGSFMGTRATCTNGQTTTGRDGCVWPLAIARAKLVTATLRWDAVGSLTLGLSDSGGHDIVPPAVGSEGSASLAARLPVGIYWLRVTGPAGRAAPTHFTLAAG